MFNEKPVLYSIHTHRNLRKAVEALLNHSLVEGHHYVPVQTTAFSAAIETGIFTPDILFILHENCTFSYSNQLYLHTRIVLLHCIAGVA